VGIVQNRADRLSMDLAHLKAEQLSASPMGVARSPLAFTAECIGFNRLVADSVAGKPTSIPSQEQREAFFASIDSLEKAQAGLKASADALAAAVEATDEATLTAEGTAPWGEPLSLYMLVYYAADHMSYHDGQVNYIQALYGDAEDHW
ncbi:DUF664 domain-containing protein, partial [bacterium]